MLLSFKKWQIFPSWNKTKEVVSRFESMEEVFNIEGDIISKGSQSEIFSQIIEGKTYFVKRYFSLKGLGNYLGFS